MKKSSSLIAALMGLVLGAQADTVILKDGSTIKGNIEQVYQGKIRVATSFAGKVTLDLDKVESFDIDSEKEVELAKSQNKSTKISYSKGKLEAAGSKPSDELPIIWLPGENHPSYKAPAEWKYNAYADLVKKTGNTDSEDLGLGFTASYAPDDYSLKLYAKYKEATSNDVKSTNELILGFDYEKNLDEVSSIYARSSWERDRVEGIKSRLSSAVGYSHYFIKDSETVLRGRLGLSHRYESYFDKTVDNVDEPGLDLAVLYTQKLGTWGNWYTDITYTPTFDNPGSDFYLTHESGIKIPLAAQTESLKLSLSTGVAHQYNSQPAPGKAKQDTTYFLRLNADF